MGDSGNLDHHVSSIPDDAMWVANQIADPTDITRARYIAGDGAAENSGGATLLRSVVMPIF